MSSYYFKTNKHVEAPPGAGEMEAKFTTTAKIFGQLRRSASKTPPEPTSRLPGAEEPSLNQHDTQLN